ncbi:MAG: aminotransferase class IV [Clostridia bacterium]|nr:aminotransferase class IV [Clostridia bacterium]
MMSFAYYNGRFDKKENITIPLTDRSVYFGDAVYDVAIGCYDRILWEDEHINRLLYGAKKLGITHSYTFEFISSLLREIAVKSMIESYIIYIQLSRSYESRKHSAIDCGANLLITIDPFQPNIYSPPMKLMTYEDKRYDFCDIKTTNLIPAVLASTEAELNGFDEAVFVRQGIVTECSKSNISILKQGRLITHPKSCHILPGITREHLLLVCKAMGIAVHEEPFTINDLFTADEIIVTSSTKLCRSVSDINGVRVGGQDSDTFEKIRLWLNKDYLHKIC